MFECRVTDYWYAGPTVRVHFNTYPNYSSEEHQDIDSRAIHTTLCPHLPPLRNPPPVAGSTEERQKKKKELEQLQVDLSETAISYATNFLISGQFELAMPAALQALRLGVNVFGANSSRLVPAYLQLGEASVGLGKLQQAEEYLH